MLPSLLVGLITAFLLQVRPFTPAKPFRLLVPLRSDAAIFLALLAAIFFAHAHILHGADRTSAQHGSATKMSVFFCAYATALFAALLALPWIVRGIRLRPTAGHLVAGGLCLFLLHFRHGLWTETKFDSYVANPRTRTDLAALSPTISLLRESFESTGQPARVAGIGGVLAPGFNAVLGLEHFNGADALTNTWQRDLLEKSSIPLTADRRSFLTRASFPRTRTFGDLWNIRWYLGDPAELPHEVNGIEAVKALDLDIYVSHRAWPRAFFTDRLPECSSLENFIELLTSADGRPFAAIVPAKPSDAKPAQPESLTGRAVVAAHDYRLTENSTAFTIEAPTPGVAVLGNSFEPGNWRVTLDGRPVECFRVNHAFLGGAIPDASVHTLRFSYWPHTLTPALKIALGGLLLALSAVCLGIQKTLPVHLSCTVRAARTERPPHRSPATISNHGAGRSCSRRARTSHLVRRGKGSPRPSSPTARGCGIHSATSPCGSS